MTYSSRSFRLSLFTACTALLILSGCTAGGVRESLGLNKDSPDEFAVVKRAPLEMPDTLALPPPTPGAPRPQEQTPIKEAKEAVFGHEDEKASGLSPAEAQLLTKTQADDANPNIRNVVDSETAQLVDRNKPGAQKILGLATGENPASASVVDAKKEAERLKKNMEEGKPVTDGKTPIIEE